MNIEVIGETDREFGKDLMKLAIKHKVAILVKGSNHKSHHIIGADEARESFKKVEECNNVISYNVVKER